MTTDSSGIEVIDVGSSDESEEETDDEVEIVPNETSDDDGKPRSVGRAIKLITQQDRGRTKLLKICHQEKPLIFAKEFPEQ